MSMGQNMPKDDYIGWLTFTPFVYICGFFLNFSLDYIIRNLPSTEKRTLNDFLIIIQCRTATMEAVMLFPIEICLFICLYNREIVTENGNIDSKSSINDSSSPAYHYQQINDNYKIDYSNYIDLHLNISETGSLSFNNKTMYFQLHINENINSHTILEEWNRIVCWISYLLAHFYYAIYTGCQISSPILRLAYIHAPVCMWNTSQRKARFIIIVCILSLSIGNVMQASLWKGPGLRSCIGELNSDYKVTFPVIMIVQCILCISSMLSVWCHRRKTNRRINHFGAGCKKSPNIIPFIVHLIIQLTYICGAFVGHVGTLVVGKPDIRIYLIGFQLCIFSIQIFCPIAVIYFVPKIRKVAYRHIKNIKCYSFCHKASERNESTNIFTININPKMNEEKLISMDPAKKVEAFASSSIFKPILLNVDPEMDEIEVIPMDPVQQSEVFSSSSRYKPMLPNVDHKMNEIELMPINPILKAKVMAFSSTVKPILPNVSI